VRAYTNTGQNRFAHVSANQMIKNDRTNVCGHIRTSQNQFAHVSENDRAKINVTTIHATCAPNK
jgi:hypothetical protein